MCIYKIVLTLASSEINLCVNMQLRSMISFIPRPNSDGMDLGTRLVYACASAIELRMIRDHRTHARIPC